MKKQWSLEELIDKKLAKKDLNAEDYKALLNARNLLRRAVRIFKLIQKQERKRLKELKEEIRKYGVAEVRR